MTSKNKQLIVGRLRFTSLSDKILRIEAKSSNGFLDSNTFFIPNRNEFEIQEVTAKEDKDLVLVNFEPFEIKAKKDSRTLSDICVYEQGTLLFDCGSITSNSGELPPMSDTPKLFRLLDNPRVVFDSKDPLKIISIEEDAKDIYLLKTDSNPYALRKLFVELTGRTPLLRRGALGVWNSRYYAYTQEEATAMVLEYEKRDIPLDNIVIDTDWRKSQSVNGIGYDVNTDLFPDMRGFLSFAHAHNVEVMFNDHPEPIESADNMFDAAEAKCRKEKLQGLLSLGLDTWWYDRNWIARLKSPTKQIKPETFGSYVFSEITKDYHESNKISEYKLRDDVMSNVNNINNGDYQSISDSAFHRFPFAWSGDIASSEESLSAEVGNMIKAESNLITYFNSDIGGHTGNPDKEPYLKWIMYGCFSPILRPHCTNSVIRYREPWNYDEETVDIFRDAVKCRYRLLPLLYTQAFLAYRDGRPLICNYNELIEDDLKDVENEYLFCDKILVSPIEEIKISPIKPANFTSKVHAKYYYGTELKGDAFLEKDYEDINFILNGNSSFDVGVPLKDFSISIDTSLKFSQNTNLYIANDDGARVYIDGRLVFDDWKCHGASNAKVAFLKKNKEYKLHIEYFQGGGDAALILSSSPSAKRKNTRDVFLPRGKWIDVYTENVYVGKCSISREYGLGEIPLFIRSGSIIPLTEEKQTTKEMDFSKLTLDCYLDKMEERFSYYDDDAETDGYMYGEYSYTYGTCSYDDKENTYNIKLGKSIGKLHKHRKLKFRLHIDEGMVLGIRENTSELLYAVYGKDKGAKLFSIIGGSRTSSIIEFEIDKDDEEEKEITIILK